MNKHIHLPLSVEQLEFSIVQSPASIRDEWEHLAEYAHGPYTCYAWCESWYRAANAQKESRPMIVVGRRPTGEIEMILPLCIERRGGIRILSRPARGVSGDFGGVFSPSLKKSLEGTSLNQFWKRVFKAVPADLLVINGVSSVEIESGNPLGNLFRVRSVIDGFHTDLEGNWESQYEKMFSSKIRRNDRRCLRRMQEEGEMTFEVIEGARAQTQMLNEMLAQKSKQLEEAGMHHHYGDPTVKAFFSGLAELLGESEDQEFLLVALRFNGEIIAQNFGVRKADCHFGLMTSMRADMRKYSPGRLVMLETARVITEKGCTYYDFGNGEYQYKQYWCTGNRERYTLFAPTSPLGKALFPALRLGLWLRNRLQARAAKKTKKPADPKP